mgnify:CR=1 FL=1
MEGKYIMNVGIAVIIGLLIIFMMVVIYIYLEIWKLLIDIHIDVQDTNWQVRLQKKQNYTMKELEAAIKHE